MKIYFAIGGGRIEESAMLNCGVKNILYSYAKVKGKAKLKLPYENIFIDSGAFGVKSGTADITLESYTLWLQLYLDKFKNVQIYANFDDIDSWEKSAKNLEYMRSHGLDPLPVFHYREPIEALDKMCSEREYICLGGLVSEHISLKHKKAFWEYVYERYPDNKFHLFGINDMNVITKYQPMSMDATSWDCGTKYRKLFGYKDGMPCSFELEGFRDGYEIFFTTEELWMHNIRAIKDWEKLEWLSNVKEGEGEQIRLI